MPLPLGTRLGPYEIQSAIGAGGMGEVYKARDTRLDRTVAIKVLPPDVSADPDRRARFEREAKTIAGLSHPHICPLFDVGDHEGAMFLVMEHLAGQTLAERLEKGPLPLKQALTIGTEIADALSAAHRQGVIHRDLKPGNVILTKAGAKLLDFGLAKLAGHGDHPAVSVVTAAPTRAPLTGQGVIVGTLQYMAPEQVEGKPADARADIWALGAIVYEMLTGKPAFAGDTAASLIAAILDAEPEPIASLEPLTPPSLDRVARTCLEKDPDARWQAASDVARELHWIATDSSADAASSVGFAPRAPARASARRRLYISAVIAVSLIVIAGFLWRSERWQTAAPPRLLHLTTAPGAKDYPALSPDGKQVAYQWSGEDGSNQDIWVKLLGSTESRRLTTDPLPDGAPCWSPDGARIAFRRGGGPGREPSVLLMSALGGDEEKLGEVPNFLPRGMAWSPNGKWLAVPRGRPADAPSAASAGIYFLPVSGGDAIHVTSAPVSFDDLYPAFSPDGASLAFVRFCGGCASAELYVQRLTVEGRPDGAPRQITRGGLAIHGLSWHPDGKSLIMAAQPAFNLSYLYRVSLGADRAPERIELVPSRAFRPSTAPGVPRLVFQGVPDDEDIWRLAKGGVPEPVIQSSLFEWSPALSPDGQRVAFGTNRNGETTEIWTADADGSRQQQLTHGPGRNQGSPAWSPDGRSLAFDSQGPDGKFDIWVIDAGGGPPRRITSDPSNEHNPSWSRDGRWIYFRSNRSGIFQYWRAPSSGGQWEQITAAGPTGPSGIETVDGKGFIYMDAEGAGFLRPLDGRPQRKIIDYASSGFAVTAEGVYYFGRRGSDNQFPLLFHRLSTGATAEQTRVRFVAWGIAVSPDGTLLYAAGRGRGPDIMLIDGIR